MSAPDRETPRSGSLVAGGAVLMVICCAVGPAVLGAVAGGAIGGWLGVVCAVLVAAAAGLALRRRRGKAAC